MQDKANNLSQPLQQQLAPFDMFMNSCSHEDYYNRGYPWKSGTGMVYSTAFSLGNGRWGSSPTKPSMLYLTFIIWYS